MSADSFVGRHDELAALTEALQAVRSEGPRVVIVGGEAGAGKTRLLDHAAGQAQAAGLLVLRTACVELGPEGLPLAPLTAVLRTLVRERGEQWFRTLLPEADTLLRLLPELGLTDLANLAPAAGDHQARVFDLFGALLRRLAGERPLLVVVDDLQWADRSTRELLGLLARTLHPSRVVLAAAYRSDDLVGGHPLRPFLAQLERVPGVSRIELGRLTRAETAELMTHVLGRPPGREALAQVYRRSAGNPYFASELLRAPAGAAVPDSLQDLLTGQIEQLPAPAAQVVRLTAAGGQPVPHGLLAATAGLPESQLLAALRAATAAGVLRADPAGYTFRHRLLRDATLQALLPAERVQLHRTYAEALEADPELVPADRYATEVAFHWYGAGVAAKAMPALLRAADQAGHLHAYPEQVQLLDRALRLPGSGGVDRLAGSGSVDRLPASGGPDRLALFEQAVTAATWAGETTGALDLIDRALSEVDHAATPDRAAKLLGHRAVVLQNMNRDGALAAVEEALDLSSPGDRSLARAQVLDLAAAVLAMRGLAVQARELAAEAADIATSHGEKVLAANALTTLGWMHNHAGQYSAGLAALRKAEQLAREADDPVRLVRVYLNLTDRSQRLGEFPSMIEAARSGWAAAQRAGVLRTLGALLLSRLGTAHVALGQWDAADEVVRQAVALEPAAAPGAEVHALRAELALARGETGRARDELALARTLLGGEQAQRHPNLVRLEAEHALSENRIDGAAELVGTALAAGLGTAADPYDAWRLLITAARVRGSGTREGAIREGAIREAAIRESAIREAADGLPTDTPLYAAFAAQIAAEFGDRGASWAEVVAGWDELGTPYLAAWARVRAAAAGLRRGDTGTARQLLGTAAGTARSLRAEPLRGEVDAVARSARISVAGEPAVPPRTGGVAPLGLTGRELEVLRLVSTGRSNRQIGEELFISPKTVSVHVSNLLGKLGVDSRGAAAALAHRLHLFDGEAS